MGYLESIPRGVVTLYIPLGIFVFVLLFPFYWMGTTAFKPNAELLSREGNPFWVAAPTLDHFKKLLFDTPYPSGCGTRSSSRWSRRSFRWPPAS
jgi:multiple sugar transport system permease protein